MRFPFGQVGSPLSTKQFVAAENIRGGNITAQQLVLAGGTHGVIRSENFVPDPLVGWAIFGDGSAFFGSSVLVGGDIYSANWDGTVPANLASVDAGATAGYYFDTSVGAAQIMGDIFLGGSLQLDGSGSIKTAASGLRTELNADNGYIEFFASDGTWTGSVGTVPALFGTHDLVFTVGAGGGDLVLDAFTEEGQSIILRSYDLGGLIFEVGDGSVTNSLSVVDVLNPSTPYLLLDPGVLRMFGVVRVNDGTNAAPSLAFGTDTDTGFYLSGANQIGLTAGGTQLWFFGSSYSGSPITGSVNFLTTSAGSVSTPSITFNSDGDTGIYRHAANDMRMTAGGTFAAYFQPGAVGIATSTTGSAANLFHTTSGNTILRSTSALKYKTKLSDVDFLADIELKPQKFWRKDDKRWYYGFIADWLGDQDPLLGHYVKGEIDNFNDRAVMAVLAAKVNRLEKLVLNSEN